MIANNNGQNTNTNRPKALFFGGIHMDVLGKCAAPAIAGSSNPGKLSRMPGGSSLNCASVARQLGLSCSIIGKIGGDSDGQIIQQTLSQRKIGNLLYVEPSHTTGNYISIVNPNGELEIAFNDLQLNETLNADWLKRQYTQEMRSHDIWAISANLNEETLIALTNPDQPIRPKILAAATISQAKSKRLAHCLLNIDLLMTNIAEARALVGEFPGPLHYIRKMVELGAKSGTLTQGAKSVWIWENEQAREFIPPKMEDIADVIGAGDAFAGALLAQLAIGKNLEQATPIAIAAAQMILKTNGPWRENLTRDDLQFIANEVEHLSTARYAL